MYFSFFRTSTIEEKGYSDFKLEVVNVFQKLSTDKNCLSYENSGTPEKIVIDKNKLDDFVSKYSGTEPECAKSLNFDYNIKVVQYFKNFSLYPGDIYRPMETMLDLLCSNYYSKNNFIYISCNYKPAEYQNVCQACSEFDMGYYKCDPSWGCGDDPLNNCPYNGSNTTSPSQLHCPFGKPPNGMCCIYRLCPVSACNQVVSTSVHSHPHCYAGFGTCNVSKCRDPQGSEWYFDAHCTKGIVQVLQPSNDVRNVVIPSQTYGFGVGFGVSAFSPQKAVTNEIQLSFPVTIRYNETFSAEGVAYIYAATGELESLSTTIYDICDKAKASPNDSISFSKDMRLSLPVYYSNGRLCMLDACKIINCPYKLNFENITQEGDYTLEFSYSLSNGIKVNK